ncbi:MAG: hypothetical protein A3K77_06405 [Euryarchaeota archaeon RBG_13_31_8]|nr:MAG: hypothetical protein A3K77_06405 [Euryarchaeota archaeon RBG_13_31_8]
MKFKTNVKSEYNKLLEQLLEDIEDDEEDEENEEFTTDVKESFSLKDKTISYNNRNKKNNIRIEKKNE